MKNISASQNLDLPAARQTSKRDGKRGVEVEQSLDELSHYLDGLFRIPGIGWRFGLDSLVGLIPGVGDTATTLVSFYILIAAVRYRVPKITIARMGLNIAIDYIVGAIPFLGDAFDFVWKSNQQNMDLIRQRATVSKEQAKSGRLSDWLFVGGIMLVLVVLFFGSLFVSLYLLDRAIRAITGGF